MRKTFQLTFSIWGVLAFIALPISYRFLPNFGSWVSAFLLPFNQWFCTTVFNIDVSETYLISDSAAFYSTAVILLFVAIIVAVITRLKQNNLLEKLSTVCYFILVYWLSYFLIRYGFDKIIGEQFYFPAPNTLHTPVGYLSKDILFWSTMGTSSTYNYFMAVTEIVAGCLLLWKRTRFLGLICSLGVLANVLATNIGFDISVKYLSGLLLFTSIILLSYHFQYLKLLVGIHSTPKNSVPELTIPKVWKRVLKTVIIILFASETIFYGFIYKNEFRIAAKSFLVEEVEGSSEIFAQHSIHRIHFHREGYLVTETFDQQFKSYPIHQTPAGFRLNNLNFAINETKTVVSWNENGKLNEWKVRESELGKLPLSEDESNWCVERMMKN